MERWIHAFPSKRNSLILLEQDGRLIVRKQFKSRDDLQEELAIYQQLSPGWTPHAAVVRTQDRWIDFSYLSGIPLAEVLAEQSRSRNVNPIPWYKLVDWLLSFTAETGQIQQDCNLGNYLYDEKEAAVVGVDFESCKPGSPEEAIGQVCAHILANNAEIGSFVAEEILAYCCERGVDSDAVQAKLRKNRRKLRMRRNVAAVMIAAAPNSHPEKMGTVDSADEMDSFRLHLQKLHSLGIAEIYASGFTENTPGIVALSDMGIQTILEIAHKRNLLMLRMDAPLWEEDILFARLDTHLSEPAASQTVLYQNEKEEPLIAVYTKDSVS